MIEKTDDGSATLFVPELNEHYHSTKGARTESQHIFINMGQGEKYEKSYKELRDAMSLCGLYNGKESKDEQRSDQPDSAGEGTE